MANDPNSSSEQLIKPAVVNAEVIREIVAAITSLRFGAVEITVHDARVTQIERREKIRFDRPPKTAP